MRYIWVCPLCKFVSHYYENWNATISPDTGELICKRCDETMLSVPVVGRENRRKNN